MWSQFILFPPRHLLLIKIQNDFLFWRWRTRLPWKRGRYMRVCALILSMVVHQACDNLHSMILVLWLAACLSHRWALQNSWTNGCTMYWVRSATWGIWSNDLLVLLLQQLVDFWCEIWICAYIIAGAKNKGSHSTRSKNKGPHLSHSNDARLEQNLPSAESVVAEDRSEMDRHSDQRYPYMSMHQFTPGVPYVTPVGSSLQTPFDGRANASQHYNMAPSHSFHSRDASHLRPSSHIPSLMSSAHSMPDLEATPFQAIVNPLENGHRVMHGSMTTLRPYSWHMTPSRVAAVESGVGKTPSFRRTPGARRNSPRAPHNSQPMPEPHSMFRPSSYLQTGTQGSNMAVPVREFSENDLRRAPSVGSAASYPASVRSRSSMEPVRFEVGSSLTDGVELVVSNLDYNISSHEWQKILTCEMQQHVQV